MQAGAEEVSAQPLMIGITPVGCSTPEVLITVLCCHSL
jgi:hypothetical protein